jgi:hypothetical protein
MATPRLPFLWPMLFNPTKTPRARASISNKNVSSSRQRCRHLSTTPRRSEPPSTQRYGQAYEHTPPALDQEPPKEPQQKSATPADKPPQDPVHEEAEEEDVPAPTSTPSTPAKASTIEEITPPMPTPPPDPPKTGESKPLESVLHMPTGAEEDYHKAPHLKTPPYVHHFDTYGLVRKLSQSSYTPSQSISIMKAVRQTLLTNMALAREGLVSKSNVENETYLFRAACSELKTEISNLRKGEMERMRTERGGLQHEVDILGQRLGQETQGLRDELKGLFDDRKMAVRQEQRSMETKVCLFLLPWHFDLGDMIMDVWDADDTTDPRAQLQNHSRPKLGRPLRSRRPALGPHPPCSDYSGHFGFHALRSAAVYELCAASATGGEEEESTA